MRTVFREMDWDSAWSPAALVLTHPTVVEDDRYTGFLEAYRDELDFFAIPMAAAHDTGQYEEPTTVHGYRKDLPPQYLDGVYERMVSDVSGDVSDGTPRAEEALDLVRTYDAVVVGGVDLNVCERRTYNGLVRARDAAGTETVVGLAAPVSFAETVDGYASITRIHEQQLDPREEEVLEGQFRGDEVPVFRFDAYDR